MFTIKLTEINKSFELNQDSKNTFLARLLKLNFGKKNYKKVLEDISLEINSGEFVCFIGNNGSGKSTLLRVISGIYKDCSGTVETKGKIVSLINMSAGMKERLSMRENIYLVCSLFGLSKKETDLRINDICEFSDLQNYVDVKIYKFSSGMLQRLAFSIAIHCDPDILILDEVFEVGDKNFRAKSSRKIHDLILNNKNVLLVTHGMEMIRDNGTRVIWLENGKIRMDGETKTVVDKYLESN